MKILKIGVALGTQKIKVKDIIKKNYQKVIKTTGISKVFHATNKEDIISLATKASKKVLKKETDVDAIILITQTPKYNIPPNSFIIQKNLNIQKKCLVFDINQGCSGYIYGLKVADSLLNSKEINKILLITTDNYSRYCKKLNVKLLFSDCATATILVKSKDKIKFKFYSDGNNYSHLSQKFDNYSECINNNSLHMDGNKLFNFSLNAVPDLINELMKENRLTNKNLNYIFLHQASSIINKNIMNKLKIENNKFLTNYKKFGNTVSSTIPLLLYENFNKLKNKKILLCGFGVGLSVSSCFYEFK
ncbi:ketoacyl-ACP synthase III [Candidatus Pelagibacter sp.]|nr:ketoacyl-ACP synthase III [Candidatus Pelagibacter sp.]MDC0992585.1 ketoacyl-ACP synthase III [Candidatus Pelagibacter sp.]